MRRSPQGVDGGSRLSVRPDTVRPDISDKRGAPELSAPNARRRNRLADAGENERAIGKMQSCPGSAPSSCISEYFTYTQTVH